MFLKSAQLFALKHGMNILYLVYNLKNLLLDHYRSTQRYVNVNIDIISMYGYYLYNFNSYVNNTYTALDHNIDDPD